MNISMLKKYAKLVLKIGINLKKGDELYIAFNESGIALSRVLAEYAYKMGAKHVELIYSDDTVKRLALEHEDHDTLAAFPKWYQDRANGIARNKACYIAILSDRPDYFSMIDGGLMADVGKARNAALKEYYDAATCNAIRWCLCAMPNRWWATKMFPDLSPAQAEKELERMIIKTMRLDTPNPTKAWKEHNDELERRSAFLTSQEFDHFEITNSIGTNLNVGMPKGYYFSGASEFQKGKKIAFTANMPTEEVFSLPHKYRVNGTVHNAMPLVHNGKIVDDFYLTLKDGRIVDYHAGVGQDVLKGIIESDEGSHYLGEIAFVQFDSPIRNLNTLFYETLFDENASCHLAIGEAYPMIKGANDLSEEEQDKLGINNSCVHVDFMYGTADLHVVGVKADGNRIDIIRDGNFVID